MTNKNAENKSIYNMTTKVIKKIDIRKNIIKNPHFL